MGPRKKGILQKLDYPKLLTPIQKTLDIKNNNLKALYKTVNDAVENGENAFIKIKKDKEGNRVWRDFVRQGREKSFNKGI